MAGQQALQCVRQLIECPRVTCSDCSLCYDLACGLGRCVGSGFRDHGLGSEEVLGRLGVDMAANLRAIIQSARRCSMHSHHKKVFAPHGIRCCSVSRVDFRLLLILFLFKHLFGQLKLP